MFPYEVMDKGLKRYTGNSVNSNTKRNKNLAGKHMAKKAIQNMDAADKLRATFDGN